MQQLPVVEQVPVPVEAVDERPGVASSAHGDLPLGDQSRPDFRQALQHRLRLAIRLPVLVRGNLVFAKRPLGVFLEVLLGEQAPAVVAAVLLLQDDQWKFAATVGANDRGVAKRSPVYPGDDAAIAGELLLVDRQLPDLVALPAEDPLDPFFFVVRQVVVRMDLEVDSAPGAAAHLHPEVVQNLHLFAAGQYRSVVWEDRARDLRAQGFNGVGDAVEVRDRQLEPGDAGGHGVDVESQYPSATREASTIVVPPPTNGSNTTASFKGTSPK